MSCKTGYGEGERACIGHHVAQAQIRNVVPGVLRTRRLRSLARRPERLVERATIISPARGVLVVASGRSDATTQRRIYRPRAVG